MSRLKSETLCRLLATALLLAPVSVPAWDGVGHRLTAAVAVELLSESKRAQLLEILAAHPRYREDFLEQMPAFVRADESLHEAWLLGQAAWWPDLVRGLRGAERERYHRGNWHYTDGAWVRGAATETGNVYVGIDASLLVAGEPPAGIRTEAQAHNVVTALDYNGRVLADASKPAPERAVALCWLLHLIGDIHQPLHTGSLYSASAFANGDRGGNGIPTRENYNLHSSWDRALRDEGIAASLPLILEQLDSASRPVVGDVASDWTLWLRESRELLRTVVYTDAMKNRISEADRRNGELAEVTLPAEYRAQMKSLARQQTGLAGRRLAIWFENELP